MLDADAGARLVGGTRRDLPDRLGDLLGGGAGLVRRGVELAGGLADRVGGILELADRRAEVRGHGDHRLAELVPLGLGGQVVGQVVAGDRLGHVGRFAQVGDHVPHGIRHHADLVAGVDRDLLVELADRDRLGGAGDGVRAAADRHRRP